MIYNHVKAIMLGEGLLTKGGLCMKKKSLSNDPGKVDSNFFCYAATVLSPHRNVLIFTQRMHKPT